MTLQQSNTPLTTQTLKIKLQNLWPCLGDWSVLPLGKGCFEFNFQSVDDMRMVLAQGVINLKPCIIRFSCRSSDLNTQSQLQTHAQIWVRLMQLPQEYWREKTLFEIAYGVGTPSIIDKATQSRLFGIYARILVDVDMSSKLFDSVILEREGYAFTVEVQYERHPLFCCHDKFIGHTVQQCNKLVTSNVQDKRNME